jgi:hypothetical protein
MTVWPWAPCLFLGVLLYDNFVDAGSLWPTYICLLYDWGGCVPFPTPLPPTFLPMDADFLVVALV